MGGKLGYIERPTVDFRVTSIGTGTCLLAYEGGRGHLSAGHTINGIVDENHCNILAAIERMYRLTSTDTCHISIALVGKHESVGP